MQRKMPFARYILYKEQQVHIAYKNPLKKNNRHANNEKCYFCAVAPAIGGVRCCYVLESRPQSISLFRRYLSWMLFLGCACISLLIPSQWLPNTVHFSVWRICHVLLASDPCSNALQRTRWIAWITGLVGQVEDAYHLKCPMHNWYVLLCNKLRNKMLFNTYYSTAETEWKHCCEFLLHWILFMFGLSMCNTITIIWFNKTGLVVMERYYAISAIQYTNWFFWQCFCAFYKISQKFNWFFFVSFFDAFFAWHWYIIFTFKVLLFFWRLGFVHFVVKSLWTRLTACRV